MKILLFVIIVLLFFALLVISNNNLSFLDNENIKIFFNLYTVWFDKVFLNMQSVTGNFVEMNWLP